MILTLIGWPLTRVSLACIIIAISLSQRIGDVPMCKKILWRLQSVQSLRYDSAIVKHTKTTGRFYHRLDITLMMLTCQFPSTDNELVPLINPLLVLALKQSKFVMFSLIHWHVVDGLLLFPIERVNFPLWLSQFLLLGFRGGTVVCWKIM